VPARERASVICQSGRQPDRQTGLDTGSGDRRKHTH
jgi:hypothetical protein